MKNQIHLFSRFLIFYFVLMMCSSCWILKNPREPQVDKITNIKVGKMHDAKIDLTIFTKLYNPDKVKFRIKKVDLDITVNGHMIAKITNPATIRIPKETNPIIEWNVEANLLKLIKPGMLLSVFAQQKMKLEIVGHIKVKKFPFSKTIPVKLDSPFEIPYK